jgi:hypothetical protein
VSEGAPVSYQSVCSRSTDSGKWHAYQVKWRAHQKRPFTKVFEFRTKTPESGDPERNGLWRAIFRPQFHSPKAFISPTHAASQHRKTISDQCLKPCWKNRLTLKLWRESPESERKSPTIPPPHHQGFWRKDRKYSGISEPTQGREHVCGKGSGVPYGIRTRAANVKGWCPRPLDERDKAGRRAQ